MNLGAITAASTVFGTNNGQARSVGPEKEVANSKNTQTQTPRNAQRSSSAASGDGEAVSVASLMKAASPLQARRGALSNITSFIGKVTGSTLLKAYARNASQDDGSAGQAGSIAHVA